MKITYSVFGTFQGGQRSSCSEWFGSRHPTERGFKSYIDAKTYPHALRQYYKLPVRIRQIDAHGVSSKGVGFFYVKKYHGYEKEY